MTYSVRVMGHDVYRPVSPLISSIEGPNVKKVK